MSHPAGIILGMDENTYRDRHGYLWCAVHRRRMIHPPPLSKYDRRYGKRPKPAWCYECRHEQAGQRAG